MRPIFTIHAGEFIFGEEVERVAPKARLWMPTKDTGVDFFITGALRKSGVGVQVKMSRDYRPLQASSKFDEALEGAGWFVFSAKKLATSEADIWSLLVVSRERRKRPYFINIPPRVLLENLRRVHGEQTSYHLYVWVISARKIAGNPSSNELLCLEGRNIKEEGKAAIVTGDFQFGDRNLTKYLESWEFLERLS